MSKAVTVTNSEYRNLPLAQLQESPTNPRRRFDEHTLSELAASFKSQGVLQPLLVRVIGDDKYEVIAGARRLRAAKLAELTDVPVRIVALSDSDCVIAQLIENIQREGVHPMEEALAFDALLRLESPRYDIAAVAQKAGKSLAFVAQRQRLVELIPSIAEAFLADQIGVGHALEIAKLPQDAAGESLRCRVPHGLEWRQRYSRVAAIARPHRMDRAEYLAFARFRAV